MKITTEQKILLKILKGEPSIQLEDANPDKLFNLFQRHRLLPLAYEIIDLLDESDREQWKKSIQIRAIKSLHFTSVLQNVINKLGNSGIDAIPLKGPALAFSLYGDINQRHIRDLDLYVRREDINRAVEALEGMGFELFSPKGNLSEKQWQYYFKYKYDIGLINKSQQIIIELHLGILYPKLLKKSEDSIIKDQEVVKMAGADVWCMSKNSTFLYLTIHGAHHIYFRLFWLRDIAAALKSWELDHKKILEIANQYGIERLLGLSLILANEYFDVIVPEEYLNYLNNDSKMLNRLKKLCSSAIFGREFPSFKGKMRKFYFYMALKPGLNYKWVTLISIYHRWYIRRFLDR